MQRQQPWLGNHELRLQNDEKSKSEQRLMSLIFSIPDPTTRRQQRISRPSLGHPRTNNTDPGCVTCWQQKVKRSTMIYRPCLARILIGVKRLMMAVFLLTLSILYMNRMRFNQLIGLMIDRQEHSLIRSKEHVPPYRETTIQPNLISMQQIRAGTTDQLERCHRS